MPPVSVLIKPSSSACNMECKYCFYKDEAANRENEFCGMLSGELSERIIARTMEYAEGSCTFLFQGGEPTLCGLDFFKEFVALEKKYAKSGVKVYNSIQTNGLLIDDEWALFLKENSFLTGLSLDGNAYFHDINRTDTCGRSTFNRVMKAAATLEKHGADFNILTVLTGANARSGAKIYNFFKKQGFKWLQFIPCLEPLGTYDEKAPLYLSAKDYKSFLVTVFRLWLQDLENGEYTSVRFFDNLLRVAMGMPPEICSMRGCCGIQFVVEGDGSVYPCDFYVLDEWKIGNVNTESFQGMINSENARRFVEISKNVPKECKKCRFYCVCRNGCRRERAENADGSIGLNRFCEAYKGFYEECGAELDRAVRILRKINQ